MNQTAVRQLGFQFIFRLCEVKSSYLFLPSLVLSSRLQQKQQQCRRQSAESLTYLGNWQESSQGTSKYFKGSLWIHLYAQLSVSVRTHTHADTHTGMHKRSAFMHTKTSAASVHTKRDTYTHSLTNIFCLSFSFELFPTLLSTEKSEKSH